MSLLIHKISGFATIQDAGRSGFRGDGVPLCGAMDLRALALANSLVGNPPAAAAIEWALAGGSLRFSSSALVAVTGAEVELTRNGAVMRTNIALDFHAGDELAVGRFIRGAYAYVAVRGGIDVPAVLGSRSTYLAAAFGGLEGRRLRAGDALTVATVAQPYRPGETQAPSDSVNGAPTVVKVIEGPNAEAFPQDFRESFWASVFTVSASSNRTGFRLERDPQPDPESRSRTSEPTCVGAIQVPDGESAIVLMADGPTVGGYPKIGVVASVDVPLLAQRTPGDVVKFKRITVNEAQGLLRANRWLARRDDSA